MARLTIVPVEPKGSYPTLPLAADSADFTWQNPGVAADGIGFANDGRVILLVRNTNAGAQTVTISSVALLGRTGDITAYSIGTNEFAIFGPFDTKGWNQAADGQVYAAGAHINVQFCAVRLPGNLFVSGN